MEPASLGFFADAKIRVHDSVVLPATPDRVFEVLAEPTTWPKWFALMTKAEWKKPDETGLGATRHVELRAFGRFDERFITWEPGKRLAFTMTASDSPLARSIAEDWVLQPLDGGGTTRVDWSFAADPTPIGAVIRKPLEVTMVQLFRASGRGLVKYLRRNVR